MNGTLTDGHADRQEEAFQKALPSMSLSELQDVFGHLDREKYPERIEAVREHMHDRIALLDDRGPEAQVGEPAGVFRRLWGSLLDVFVSFFPLVVYLGFRMLAAAGGDGGGRGGGRGGRGVFLGGAETGWVDQVVGYVTSPEAIWGTVETYGPWLLGFIAYRALFVLPQLTRSGRLPGMAEAGVRLVSESGGSLTWHQVGIRFSLAYFLGVLTLGISHIWPLWDGQRRTLFDRIAATRVVRTPRRWEKSEEHRLLED